MHWHHDVEHSPVWISSSQHAIIILEYPSRCILDSFSRDNATKELCQLSCMKLYISLHRNSIVDRSLGSPRNPLPNATAPSLGTSLNRSTVEPPRGRLEQTSGQLLENTTPRPQSRKHKQDINKHYTARLSAADAHSLECRRSPSTGSTGRNIGKSSSFIINLQTESRTHKVVTIAPSYQPFADINYMQNTSSYWLTPAYRARNQERHCVGTTRSCTFPITVRFRRDELAAVSSSHGLLSSEICELELISRLWTRSVGMCLRELWDGMSTERSFRLEISGWDEISRFPYSGM